MTMITCKECNKQKSSLAKFCPHCGFKKPNAIIELIKFSWGCFFLFIVIMIILIATH